MKVCHLTSVHPRYDQRIFYKECCSLAKSGYSVHLIVADGNGDEIKDGVHIYDVGNKASSRLIRMIKTTKAVYKKAIELNAEIYHLHDPELLPFGLKLKKKGKKVIFDSHEFYGLLMQEKRYLPAIFKKNIANWYMRYETFVCKKLDAVVQVCTVNGKNYFENRCKKSVFIANFPYASNLNPNYRVPFSDRKKAACIGSLTYARGITHLIRATSYTDVRLCLAGNWESKQYEEEVKKMPEYQNIDYLGFVDNANKNLILDDCLAGISTLLVIGQYGQVETLATKTYEYMLMGLPVIFSNFPYEKQLNEKYMFGICVNPANPKEIADAINYLKNNPEEAKQMGERGRELVLTLYNWDMEEKKLLDLYRNL